MVAALMGAAAFFPQRISAADGFRGEKTLGILAGYDTYNKEPLAGVEFTYRFSRLLRLAPKVTYVFRNAGHDALKFNVDVDLMFPLANNRCAVYPFAGFNFSSWNYHPAVPGVNTDDVSTRVSRAGLNVGAGFDVNITGSLRLSLQGCYTFIKEFHGADISAGIHYRF